MSDYDAEEIECMVNDCLKRVNKLTDWECSFISTCNCFVENKIMLSQKQRTILDEIWKRVTDE